MLGISTLAHVHCVSTRIVGRHCEVYIFDHHRSAFPLWTLAAEKLGNPLTLVTLDRHMDLERPAALLPDGARSLESVDRYARFALSPRNDDHVLAAMEAGAIGDGVIIARSHQPGSLEAFRSFVDAQGRAHRCAFARTVDLVGDDARALIAKSSDIALDIDLDCFTTLSDGHHDEVLTWDLELIDAFLRPLDAEDFWRPVLERTRLVTIAREPFHCGGFGRSAALWPAFAEAFFCRLLGVPAP
ncbi:MAG: hypothetical protein ACOX6T_20840 [Myxococcales bacterium]|jgi:hypothetical protein